MLPGLKNMRTNAKKRSEVNAFQGNCQACIEFGHSLAIPDIYSELNVLYIRFREIHLDAIIWSVQMMLSYCMSLRDHPPEFDQALGMGKPYLQIAIYLRIS